MNAATPQPRSTPGPDQNTGVFPASALLTVSAELHTGDLTHRMDIARPAAKNDSGFLGRAFRNLDDAAVL
ncbi:hypothetical protein [Rhodococcoides fascians]|uniref:hypothetical protein n=1 Tax=Rhodococcoides fascians TaxID=1828 RepID=UPI00056233D9|nr:hypothetical protein [Rhodococcus fascians]